MSYSAGSSEEDLPDKHKGERRWLGKHHHKGKDGMARQLRDRATIQKTLVDKDNTLSKKAKERLMDGCKDNMELNVAYSLNKKNRWETADPVELLKKAPDSVDAAVVQRGVRISVMNIYLGAEKTTAVHERVNNDGNGEFDVRTAKCIGAGQELSNFAEESREKSTKKARRKNKEGDEPQEINKPAIHYDVIEADRNPDIIAGHFFSNARRGKIGGKLRSRGRNELVEELYQQRFSVSDNDVGDYDDDDDVSEDDHVRSSISLSDYVIEKKKQQRQRRRRRSASVDLAEYEVVDSEPTTFKELVDIAPAMKSGHVFVNFKNQMGPNFKLDDEIEGLKSDETLEVRKIDQRRYSINATRAIRTFSETYPNSYLIVVVEELKNKQVSFIVNSSIPGNPYTVGPQDMYQRVSNANGLREVLNRFIEFFSSSFEIHRRIHCVAMAENVPLSIKERDPVEWENAKEAVKSTLRQSTPHDSWLNSELLSQKGVAQSFHDMMQLVRETSHPADDGTSDANQEDAEAPNSTSAPEYCHLCGFAGEHKLFRVKGGHLECSMCLQADLLRQIRAGSLPLQTKFVLEQGFSPYDLLPAILPLPVFNMYTKMMYSIILTGLGLTGEFIDCPNCQASLYIKDPQGEEGELPDAELIIIASVGRYFSCGHCNHHWCHDCNDVPHLSMTCEQFVEWKPKWRTQCAIENLEGFEPAFIYRIRCSCGRGEFDVSMPSSYASCPHCKLRIDPGSMEEIHQVTKRLYGRDRGRTIYGNDWYITKKPYNPLHVERIASQPQIRKEVAKLCAEARQQRFDKKAYNMMLSKVRELKRDLPDIEKLPEAYKAALLLVENVNGWMYISKRTDDCVRRSLANVTKLRQKCIEMLSSDSVDNEILAKSIRLLEDGVHSTIRTVAERLKDVQRNETNRV